MLTQSIAQAEQQALVDQASGYHKWYKLITTEFPQKAFECCIVPQESWCEPGAGFVNPIYQTQNDIDSIIISKSARGQGDLEANKLRSIRRAKMHIRQAVKMGQFDRMLTFTSREIIEDKWVFNEMVVEAIARVRSAIGDVQYVLTSEKQNRGAWHAHVAVHGRQNYKLWHCVWNSVLAKRGYTGFCHHGKRRRNHSPSKLAGYLSKYLSKELEQTEFNKKGYWISKNISAPVRSIRLFKTKQEAKIFLVKLLLANGHGLADLKGYLWWHGDRGGDQLPLDVVWVSTN
jgi:hypothetical protein